MLHATSGAVTTARNSPTRVRTIATNHRFLRLSELMRRVLPTAPGSLTTNGDHGRKARPPSPFDARWDNHPVEADVDSLKLWLQKWRWYERNSLPWNRARIHWELGRRQAFARWPVHGNVLEALLEDRLRGGANVLLEP